MFACSRCRCLLVVEFVACRSSLVFVAVPCSSSSFVVCCLVLEVGYCWLLVLWCLLCLRVVVWRCPMLLLNGVVAIGVVCFAMCVVV